MKHRKNKITVKKIFCTALAALTLGAYAVTALPQYTGTGITAQAASASVDFEYSNDDYGTIIITGYKGTSSNVVIPSEIDGKSVTEIGEQAFWTCTELTSVTIPDSVESIGRRAFYCCTKLADITIPDSVESIKSSAFESCTELKKIKIGNGVKYIGNSEMGGSIMGNSIFSGCKELTNIEVSDGNKYYSSQNGILFNKNKTKLITYPAGKNGDYTVPGTVTSIGNTAFENCTELENVTITDDVTSIEKFAFIDCTKLKKVTIGNGVTSIEESSFAGCTELKDVTIGNNVTSINEFAFRYCINLSSITLPNSVTEIGDSAFEGCTRLSSIIIPESVKSIGAKTFSNCPDLTIYAKINSYVQKYADDNSINFKSIDTEPIDGKHKISLNGESQDTEMIVSEPKAPKRNGSLIQIILIVIGILLIVGITIAVIIPNKRKSTNNKQ